jgi:hypothetical protein
MVYGNILVVHRMTQIVALMMRSDVESRIRHENQPHRLNTVGPRKEQDVCGPLGPSQIILDLVVDPIKAIARLRVFSIV